VEIIESINQSRFFEASRPIKTHTGKKKGTHTFVISGSKFVILLLLKYFHKAVSYKQIQYDLKI